MNKLRYIALALCAVMAFGLICGCNDTKPAGTVSDGASQVDNTSSEDPIFTKTGKLTDEEIKIIAADRIEKYNDFLDFITNECFDKYTDKTKKLPISSPEYYKIIDDGKYNFTDMREMYIRALRYFDPYIYQYAGNSQFYSESIVLSLSADNKTAYAFSGIDALITIFNNETYIKKGEPLTEVYKADECIPVYSEDGMFIVDVPVYSKETNRVIRTDTAVFKKHDYYYLSFITKCDPRDACPDVLSKESASKLAKKIIKKYHDVEQFFMGSFTYTQEVLKSDSRESITKCYKRIIDDKKYGFEFTTSTLRKYISDLFTPECAKNYLDYFLYSDCHPVEFDFGKNKVEIESQFLLYERYIEYKGNLYDSGLYSNDTLPVSDEAEAVYVGKNIMCVVVPQEDTMKGRSTSDEIWLSFYNGEFRICAIIR